MAQSTFVLYISTFAALVTFVSANAYFSSAKLHPNCLRIEPTPLLSAEWGLKLFAGARFYIPFGSSPAIRHISELVSGKKIRKDDDVPKTCTLVRIKGFKLQMEGQGDHFLVQDCAVIKKGRNNCIVNENSENPVFQTNGDAIVTIVWTDNKDSMGIVRCTTDGLYNDWYVFSTQTSLNETVKDDILSTMKRLGFSDTMENTISPSYEDCKLFPEGEDDD